jgi:hypothetical protein
MGQGFPGMGQEVSERGQKSNEEFTVLMIILYEINSIFNKNRYKSRKYETLLYLLFFKKTLKINFYIYNLYIQIMNIRRFFLNK